MATSDLPEARETEPILYTPDCGGLVERVFDTQLGQHVYLWRELPPCTIRPPDDDPEPKLGERMPDHWGIVLI